MEYLRLFENHTEYEAFANSGNMLKPNVSNCIVENEVHYNPIGWEGKCLTIESLEDNNTIYLKASNSAVTKTVSVSTDNGKTWTEYASSTGDSGTTLATLNKEDRLLVKGENSAYASSNTLYNQFGTTGQFEVKGNIMSLISGDSFASADELTATYTFNHLFYQCTGLTSSENLVLPATTLADYCYQSMFRNCTSLTIAPELPAITLRSYCYDSMFAGCTSLTTAPKLPATTLANYCYQAMFYDCTNITIVPVLSATTLAEFCYDTMFCNCTSLTTAPELPANSLKYACYWGMFKGCTSLTTAPELPASQLSTLSYAFMFSGCTNLNSITCLATNISATNCTNNWVVGVAASGTFTKSASMSNWTTGTKGIPSNWTVQDAS